MGRSISHLLQDRRMTLNQSLSHSLTTQTYHHRVVLSPHPKTIGHSDISCPLTSQPLPSTIISQQNDARTGPCPTQQSATISRLIRLDSCDGRALVCGPLIRRKRLSCDLGSRSINSRKPCCDGTGICSSIRAFPRLGYVLVWPEFADPTSIYDDELWDHFHHFRQFLDEWAHMQEMWRR